jgi:hypothetical protein
MNWPYNSFLRRYSLCLNIDLIFNAYFGEKNCIFCLFLFAEQFDYEKYDISRQFLVILLSITQEISKKISFQLLNFKKANAI